MIPDSELLRSYAQSQSEDAFAELVRRHVNLVYSAALRQVGGDSHLAQDAAQTVYADLARKARLLARRESLAGWLYTSAHFAAAKIVRTETRRRNRENQFMREPIHEPEAGRANSSAPDWEKIRPVLDDAMHELAEADREAILLRYFENRQFAEVGKKLGLNENAARMRVERALDKLRSIFTKRGIATTAALASAITAHAVETAPAGLTATLTASSLAAAGTGSTLTLLKIMTASYVKIGVSTLVLAGVATAMVMQHQTRTRLHNENVSLRQKVTGLRNSNESLSNRLASVGQAKSRTDEQLNELLRLRGEVGILRAQTNEIGRLQAKLNHLSQNLQQPAGHVSTRDQERQMAMYRMSDAKLAAVSLRMFADDNNGLFPTNFDEVARYLNPTNLAQVYSNEFAIVYQGSMTSITNPSISILVQERHAWPMFDGKWAKVYGFADGHSQLITEPGDNFSGFEQEHMAKPALPGHQ